MINLTNLLFPNFQISLLTNHIPICIIIEVWIGVNYVYELDGCVNERGQGGFYTG